MADGPSVDHDERHELAIASLLDRDLPAAERVAAERLAATCPTCARLQADLVQLLAATRSLPVPPRPRDFALTAADAARLRAADTGPGEPRGVATRLTGEMQVPNVDHQTHDLTLVASLLDRSTHDANRARGEALVATCTACKMLHADLVVLRDATAALPVPARVRDYAISAEDARRLRRSGWRRLVGIFGSAGDVFSRPLAIGLTTIGLAGLLVTTVPWTFPTGGSTAAPPAVGQAAGDAGSGANTESVGVSKAAPAASAAPSAAGPAAAAMPAPTAAPSRAAAPAPPSSAPAPSGEAFDTFAGAAGPSADAAGAASAPAGAGQGQGADRMATTSVGRDAASVDHLAAAAVAALLLAAGVGLFVLRWAGRRV